MKKLTESEIEIGMALSALIESAKNHWAGLVMTEQMYIEKLRQARGLNEEWALTDWVKGFEVINGKQNDQ